MMEEAKVSIGSNSVWRFFFSDTHVVQIGSYVTCTCKGDFECKLHEKVVRRVWGLPDTQLVHHYQLMRAELMPPIECPICQEQSGWGYQGQSWVPCGFCWKPFHRKCLCNVKDHKCPWCRKVDYLPDGHKLDFDDMYVVEQVNISLFVKCNFK